ncbi:MAG: hypothetical protein O6934_12800 [SAR324 cluster bacterium]|nr:hypothetical protein [SAR324 cluster bacterium]
MFRCKGCGAVGCKSKPGSCPHSAFHPWVDKCLKCGGYDSEPAN